MKTVIERSQVDQLESASEARTGDAAPMGLFGLAIGTAVVAWVAIGWAPMPASLVATVPMLLVFAGIGQFAAGLLAFSRTNSWAGTAMCAYGANNVILATYFWMQAGGLIPRTGGNLLLIAVDLFCMGYLSLVLAAGAARINATYVLTTLSLAVGYTLTGIQFLGGSRYDGIVGGCFLLAACFFAFYAASAHVVNSAWRQEIVPLFSLQRD
ncbi:MAG TPA: GPR1/FUN34/YaaH family transporter [Candidatus Acidoferrales bacterium]|nr:GPR1/FUN34/YaaH family transporter [Candidatus Acidoferrales bacterium]